jgi:hypothetical protein
MGAAIPIPALLPAGYFSRLQRAVELLSDAKRREIEEVRNASNSPKDDGTYCRYHDMRADGLPIDIDIRVLQASKLRDGRLLVFRPLNRTA